MAAIIITIGLLAIFEITSCIASDGLVIPGDSLLNTTSFNETTINEPLARKNTDFGRRARRLVVNDERCTLFEMAIDTQDSIYYNNTDQTRVQKDENEWLCLFDPKYSREVLGLEDPLVRITGWSPDGNKVAQAQLVGGDDFDVSEIIESGRTSINIREGIIDREDQTMYMDSEFVEVIRNEDRIRKLQSDEIQPVRGLKTVIAVRISTNDFTYRPEVNSQAIKKTLFSNEKGKVSLKRKYQECSYRKLRIKPFQGTTTTNVNVPDGVTNVALDKAQSDEVKDLILNGGPDPLSSKRNRDRVLSFCRLAAEARLGDLESQFDHVLFILPRNLDGVLAIAIIGRFDSYYGGSWITRPSMSLHEVGHNLGLDHAGEANVYDDKVGYMGFSYDDKFGPNMCFNPANNYYFGWYSQQVASYDAGISGTGKLFVLNGVNDYNPKRAGSGDSKRLIVLRLTQTSRQWDFYIGYNRKKGINSGTEEDPNQILILRKYGPPGSSTTTRKIGTLANRGEYFEIADYNGDGSVFITFEAKLNMGKDIIIRVSTTRPTPSPTLSPSSSPTGTPTATPTRVPTPTPTAKPTFQPTPRPTFVGEITDRDDFLYKNVEGRDCNWVGENIERCALKSQRKYVQTYWCKKTCETANFCLDNLAELAYNNDPNNNCDWVEQDLSRCDRIWRNKTIRDHWCPTSCADICRQPSRIKTMRRRQDTQTARRNEI